MAEINLNHICKIEGHASLSLKIVNDKVKKCELKASEGARFFEALVINKQVKDIQEIVTRICGICSCAHSVASIEALERALGITPSPQQTFIREMLMLGERIRSHATHLYFLALPDYLGAASALDLGKEHREKINDALSIISFGNKIVEVFGGREMHPFLAIKEQVPEKIDFSSLKNDLNAVKEKALRTLELFAGLSLPKLERETDYLSIKKEGIYAIISGKIVSQKDYFEESDYDTHLKENVKEYATSKFVLHEGKPYMLGAMARINNNYANLDNETRAVVGPLLKRLGLSLPLKNPFYNILAQAIEVIEALNRASWIINNGIGSGDASPLIIKEGRGVSAVEAPRGTLFHEYVIDDMGVVKKCNIITPTAQNLNMIEADIALRVNALLEKKESKETIVSEVEKLIRAYDPCFSCSTHFLRVDWDIT